MFCSLNPSFSNSLIVLLMKLACASHYHRVNYSRMTNPKVGMLFMPCCVYPVVLVCLSFSLLCSLLFLLACVLVLCVAVSLFSMSDLIPGEDDSFLLYEWFNSIIANC